MYVQLLGSCAHLPKLRASAIEEIPGRTSACLFSLSLQQIWERHLLWFMVKQASFPSRPVVSVADCVVVLFQIGVIPLLDFLLVSLAIQDVCLVNASGPCDPGLQMAGNWTSKSGWTHWGEGAKR